MVVIGGDAKDLQRTFGEAERAGGGMGEKLGRVAQTIGKAFKVAAVAVGAAITGALAKAVTGGFSRLMALEEADKRLRSMGLSAGETDQLMSALNDTLTGTPYSLDAGATAMAGFVSAGVDLDRIPKILDSVTDAAAYGQAELGEVADIFQKVALNGRASTEMLNQLQFRGIPATALLSSALDKTGEEFRKFVSDGKLDADLFFTAWEEGALGFGDQNIQMAGAAKNAGDTVRGAWGNTMTALSRLGARVLDPLYERLPDFLAEVKDRIDSVTSAVGPMVDRFVESGRFQAVLDGIARSARSVARWVDDVAASDLWARLTDSTTSRFEAIWSNLAETWREAWPSLQRIGTSLAQATAAIGVSTWELLLLTLEVLSELLLITLVPALEQIANFMEDHPGIVQAVVGAYVAYRVAVTTLAVAQGLLNAVMAANPIVLVALALAALTAAVVWAYQNVDWFRAAVDVAAHWLTETLWPALQTVAEFIMDDVVPALREAWSWIDEHVMPVVAGLADFLATLLVDALTDAKIAIDGVVEMVKTLWRWAGDIGLLAVLGGLADFLQGTFRVAWRAARTAVGWVVDRVDNLIDRLGTLVEWAERGKEALEALSDAATLGVIKTPDGEPLRNSTAGWLSFDYYNPFSNHTGGIFRSPTPGGEGLALLRDRERVITPGRAVQRDYATDRPGGGDTYLTVHVRVEGSVTTERDLARSVADRLRREQELSPRPLVPGLSGS